MSRVVYLHVGAPKTGTTYVQDRLTRNAASLAEHGIHLPTANRLTDPATFHFRAALDLLGQDWGGPPGHARGAWSTLVRRVRRASGTVVISHEILAPAPAEAVVRAMGDLADSEVHLVYSARDLARQVPAAWQESIKQGRRWRYRRFERRAVAGKAWFSRAFDLPTVLTTWGAGLPPERIHVVTVPQVTVLQPEAPEAPRAPASPEAQDPLWLRFCQVFGIDPAWAPRQSERTNQSLGVAETEVLRQLNRRLDRRVRSDAAYDKVVRELLAQRELVRHRSHPVLLNPDRFDWAEAQADRWIGWLRHSGVDVVGDAEELRPLRPSADFRWRDPDRVRARKALGAAYFALEAMTREAATRPDPEQQLKAMVRQGAQRVWRS